MSEFISEVDRIKIVIHDNGAGSKSLKLILSVFVLCCEI